MAAQVLAFVIAEDVPPEEQDAVLEAVAAVDGVVRVERLMPDAQLPELLRLGLAFVQDGADLNEVAQSISALAGIASADVPPDRGFL